LAPSVLAFVVTKSGERFTFFSWYAENIAAPFEQLEKLPCVMTGRYFLLVSTGNCCTLAPANWLRQRPLSDTANQISLSGLAQGRRALSAGFRQWYKGDLLQKLIEARMEDYSKEPTAAMGSRAVHLGLLVHKPNRLENQKRLVVQKKKK
jgi:hypothetical protein